VPVTGDLIGTSGCDGWAFSPYNQVAGQAFRADVTSLVTGNGSYFVSNFKPMRLTIQGASLVVIYDAATPVTIATSSLKTAAIRIPPTRTTPWAGIFRFPASITVRATRWTAPVLP
jgi:hypothetical protein